MKARGVAMEEAIGTSSRRGLLGKMLALASGAVGVGLVERAATASAAVVPAPTTLVLHGRQFHLHAVSHRPGQVPGKGDRLTAYGELVGPNGNRLGHFTAAFFAFDSPFA